MRTVHRSCPTCGCQTGKPFAIVDGFQILRCDGCRFVFVDISNEASDEANVYGEAILESYYAYEPVYTMAFYDSTVSDLERACGPTPLRILDFGCGAGMFMRRARARGHEVSGIDFSPYANLARERFGLDIYCKDIRDCDLPYESFDVIISHATYEHLMDPVGISNELLRYLKPGGLFIISGVPNFSSITIQWFRNFYHNGFGHVNHFEKESLRNLFSKIGLRTVKVKPYGLAVWAIIDSIRKVAQSSRVSVTASSQESTPTKSPLIDAYDSYIPKWHEKLLSAVYTNLPPAFLCQSLEAWGRKPAQ